MDFLWLSNGFGFALEPWALMGYLFDGMNFHPEAGEIIRLCEICSGIGVAFVKTSTGYGFVI